MQIIAGTSKKIPKIHGPIRGHHRVRISVADKHLFIFCLSAANSLLYVPPSPHFCLISSPNPLIEPYSICESLLSLFTRAGSPIVMTIIYLFRYTTEIQHFVITKLVFNYLWFRSYGDKKWHVCNL